LCENKTLETLDMRCNRVDELGGAHVARALRENKTLRRLNLEENKLGDAGAVAVAEALGETTCLMQLDLRCNGIKERGLVALADGVRAMLENDAPPSELRLWGNDFGAPGSKAATAWRDVFKRADSLGVTVKADITFRVVDGQVHVARMTEIGTKEVGNRF
jgi:Ran GTPase-activating protein (RanGAP) involved in mRNA processing and transport